MLVQSLAVLKSPNVGPRLIPKDAKRSKPCSSCRVLLPSLLETQHDEQTKLSSRSSAARRLLQMPDVERFAFRFRGLSSFPRLCMQLVVTLGERDCSQSLVVRSSLYSVGLYISAYFPRFVAQSISYRYNYSSNPEEICTKQRERMQ